MAAEIVTAIVMVALFGLGYLIGEQVGWDRCWQALTRDDAWDDDA